MSLDTIACSLLMESRPSPLRAMAREIRPTPLTAAAAGAITGLGMSLVAPLQALGDSLLWRNSVFLGCAALFMVMPAVFLFKLLRDAV